MMELVDRLSEVQNNNANRNIVWGRRYGQFCGERVLLDKRLAKTRRCSMYIRNPEFQFVNKIIQKLSKLLIFSTKRLLKFPKVDARTASVCQRK